MSIMFPNLNHSFISPVPVPVPVPVPDSGSGSGSGFSGFPYAQFRPLRVQNTKKNSKKIYKNLNDLKLTFLELVHLGLCSGKVWENRFFSILHDLS